MKKYIQSKVLILLLFPHKRPKPLNLEKQLKKNYCCK